jgi:hypothetical protein
MLHNYVLWFNHYQQLWYAINRDTQNAFFGDRREQSIYLVDADINSLIKQLA